MKSNRIGSTDVRVTELGFGAAPIGNLYHAVTDEDAAAAVNAAWDGGVRYFDTAPLYGLGLSERRLGEALAGRPRVEFAVSTKVGRLLVENGEPSRSSPRSDEFAVSTTVIAERDYTADGVRRSLDASLQRLGLDRIDIVYVHDPENHVDQALNEAMPALLDLRAQGIVGAVGVGMNFVEPLLRFVTETEVDAVMLAGRWTLADRTGESVLSACAHRGVSVVSAAPFNSGLLARTDPAEDAHFNYERAADDVLAFARRLAATCADAGFTLPHAAMQFPLKHDTVAAVVAGMRSAEEVIADLEYITTAVPDGLWADLAALDAERPARLRP